MITSFELYYSLLQLFCRGAKANAILALKMALTPRPEKNINNFPVLFGKAVPYIRPKG